MKLTKYCVAVLATICLSSTAQAQRSQGHILRVGETLASGNWLTSQNGAYELHMQSADGNLVLYRQQSQIQKQWNPAGWSSGKKGGGAYLRVLEDGRLVMWRGSSWVWEWHHAGAWSLNTRLVLGPDGSLKIYQDDPYTPIAHRRDECSQGEKTWASHNTCGPNETPFNRDFTSYINQQCGQEAANVAARAGLKLCYDTLQDRQ